MRPYTLPTARRMASTRVRQSERVVPLAVETYGRVGIAFLNLLKDAATLEAENAPTRGRGRSLGREALRI